MTEKELDKKLREDFASEPVVVWKSPSFKNMRWDIFGVFDYVVLWLETGQICFVQLTTKTNLSHRRIKILNFCEMTDINPANFYFYVYAWDDKKQEFEVERII